MGNKTRSKDVEREAAKILEEWTDEQWQRVPQSGATATTHNTENHVFNGDVFNEGKYNDLCVEVKKMKNMKASHVFKPTQKIKNHLQQARDESDGKHILMMKINYQGWFVYVPASNSITGNFFASLLNNAKNDANLCVTDGRQNTYKLYYVGKQ